MERTSKVFYIARAFALLSIVLAHTYVYCDSALIRNLISRMACVGVPFFLFSSGFYFSTDRKYLSRLAKICIPWFSLGAIVNLFEIRKQLSIVVFFNSLLGINSYFYYLTNLVIIISFYYLLENKICKNKETIRTIDLILVLLTLLSIILTALDIIPYRVDSDGIVFISAYSCYLNVFNWIGFFALGHYVKRYTNFIDMLFSMRGLSSVLSIVGWFLIAVIVDLFDKYHSYFSLFAFLIELWGIIGILLLSNTMEKLTISRVGQFLSEIGQLSFFSYLIHMPFASLSKRIEMEIIGIGFPFFIILLLYLIQKTVLLVLSREILFNKIVLTCLGIPKIDCYNNRCER